MIEPKTHALLLYFLNELPFEEAADLRKELQDTYSGYLADVAHYRLLEYTIRTKVQQKNSLKGKG